MKVNMLFGQIPEGPRSWVMADGISNLDTKYFRLEALRDYLVKHVGVSDMDDDTIGPYFGGVLSMRWGPFMNPYTFERAKLAFFGGTSKRRKIGLGGSLKHVIGNIDSEPTQSASATAYILSVLLKELAPELGIDPSREYPGNYVFGRGNDDKWALRGVSVAIGNLRGLDQKVEFLAKTLLQGIDDGGAVLLGTPYASS